MAREWCCSVAFVRENTMQPGRDTFPATTRMVQEDVSGLVRTLDRAFERTVKRQAVLPLKEQLNRIENPLR